MLIMVIINRDYPPAEIKALPTFIYAWALIYINSIGLACYLNKHLYWPVVWYGTISAYILAMATTISYNTVTNI